jgi:hypothetical protein
MTVAELIEKLKEFPQGHRVVIFPDEGWSDIETIKIVFEDFVALVPPEAF